MLNLPLKSLNRFHGKIGIVYSHSQKGLTCEAHLNVTLQAQGRFKPHYYIQVACNPPGSSWRHPRPITWAKPTFSTRPLQKGRFTTVCVIPLEGVHKGPLLCELIIFGLNVIKKFNVRSTARRAIHLQFDISANCFEIKAFQTPKFIVWCAVNCIYYYSCFILEGGVETSQIFLRDTHILPKLLSYENTRKENRKKREKLYVSLINSPYCQVLITLRTWLLISNG
jgi:hypothetical protein